MQSLPPLLSELRLGTYLQYSPKGTSEISRRSREWMRAVKTARPDWVDHALDQLKAALGDSGLADFLGPDVALVPVPRSAPLSNANALWPARVISEGLVNRGMGAVVLPYLSRSEPVQKSSTAARGERLDADAHLRTIAIAPEILATKRITLVDDIVTIGRTIIASASHVRAIYPDAEVRAFGLIHTSGLEVEIDMIEAPYVGWLRRNGGWIGHDPPR